LTRGIEEMGQRNQGVQRRRKASGEGNRGYGAAKQGSPEAPKSDWRGEQRKWNSETKESSGAEKLLERGTEEMEQQNKRVPRRRKAIGEGNRMERRNKGVQRRRKVTGEGNGAAKQRSPEGPKSDWKGEQRKWSNETKESRGAEKRLERGTEEMEQRNKGVSNKLTEA
jgi:hypothetical protein